MPKYTNEFLKCSLCLRGNNFLVFIKQEGEQNYYLTQCPKCGHYEECREITARDAKYYQNQILLLDGPNGKTD